MSAWQWGAVARGLAPIVAVAVAVALGYAAWHIAAWIMDTLEGREG